MKQICLVITLLAALICYGCIPKAKVPIPYLEYSNPYTTESNKNLMVLLRGIGGGHQIFEEKGIVQNVIDRKLPYDMIAPAAHFGYYREENLGIRLYQDIIKPAKEKGYQQIWLVGTSMGGLGAIFYLIDYHTTVDGVLLLSPFLGWNGILKEIEQAGGLYNWEPGDHTVDDWQRHFWSLIKTYAEAPGDYPDIYLGYGKSDFFTRGQKLLTTTLPGDHVMVIPGGHSYATLKQLWALHLDKLDGTLRSKVPARDSTGY